MPISCLAGAFARRCCWRRSAGSSVSLLLQGRSDHILFHYATQALYDRMLAAGVRVYEYDQAELHAKVAVVDEDWATVGSSNIDPFSLLLAREANLVVREDQPASPPIPWCASLRAKQYSG
jgi:cardiolipin synthase